MLLEKLLTDSYTEYVKQVQANAKEMSKHFIDRGYNIVSGGTDNHMVLIDLRNKDISGKKSRKHFRNCGYYCK